MAKTYFLDTNVVICLAKYHKCKSIDVLMEKEGWGYYKAKSIATLYKLIDKRQIDAYICPIVYDEILQGVNRFGKDNLNFLDNSKISVVVDMPREKLELINKLGNYYFEYKGQSKEPAFDTHEEKYNGKNDAFIMAYSSICGLNIITFDNHFTTKYFTIKETNKAFMENYLISNGYENKVSKNYDNVKVHKPTFILENEQQYCL